MTHYRSFYSCDLSFVLQEVNSIRRLKIHNLMPTLGNVFQLEEHV